jgi:hypothetical protein
MCNSRRINIRIIVSCCFALTLGLILACTPRSDTDGKADVSLDGHSLKLQWTEETDGWRLAALQVMKDDQWVNVLAPSGEYTVLFSPSEPDQTPVPLYENGQEVIFPESTYKYIQKKWADTLRPVEMNAAGEALHFFPDSLQTMTAGNKAGDELLFTRDTEVGQVQASWQLDEAYPSDVVVHLTLTAKKDGYFSLATPTLATVAERELKWGSIPGHFQGAEVAESFVQSVAYGQGIPDKPILVRERTATTLAPLLSSNQGVTLAVIPAPGTGRDPWEKDEKTQRDWQLGLSLMNRKSQLTPTAYHPVLGEKGSMMRAGDTRTFTFRYTLQAADWFTVYKHAVNDVYKLGDFLGLKQTEQSLTERVLAMHKYVIDDETSLWRKEKYQGVTIGAQAYLGGVLGSEKDAMKNSDYGAMWMLARIMNDPVLQSSRLPLARNFKLMQQEQDPGFYQGSAKGQYYLYKSKRFTEEWGDYVEPIATTYYTMVDIGNILLFEPNDVELKARLRDGAERLLAWQKPAGNWEIAYDHATRDPLFTEMEDVRPTFYGLLIAYRVLGDQKYLDAARKGADWFVTNAVDKGHFLGVCGDVRFAPDFATGQSAQALLDLYEITGEDRYLQAAVETAKLYTLSIYTHPIPSTREKTVNGEIRQDWEISQAGLSNEHGGSIGSANNRGPILLASHAGLFVRMAHLTGEPLYLSMARAAALGRDAFVDPETNVASYYWSTMDSGPGPFPHHAWWQIGWITDYLMSEIELRSNGSIRFPRGFVAPKVGPHQTYGFAPGEVYGAEASLVLKQGLVKASSPYLDYTTALSTAGDKLFLMLLNNDDDALSADVSLDLAQVFSDKNIKIGEVVSIAADGKRTSLTGDKTNWTLDIPAYGLRVIEIHVI